MECGGSARNGLGPAAGTKRVQSCGKSSCVALDPLVAASLELLVDYVVSRKPRSSRLGGTLASRALRKRERRGKEGEPERTASIRRERDAESRHTNAHTGTHTKSKERRKR